MVRHAHHKWKIDPINFAIFWKLLLRSWMMIIIFLNLPIIFCHTMQHFFKIGSSPKPKMVSFFASCFVYKITFILAFFQNFCLGWPKIKAVSNSNNHDNFFSSVLLFVKFFFPLWSDLFFFASLVNTGLFCLWKVFFSIEILGCYFSKDTKKICSKLTRFFFHFLLKEELKWKIFLSSSKWRKGIISSFVLGNFCRDWLDSLLLSGLLNF